MKFDLTESKFGHEATVVNSVASGNSAESDFH